MLHSTFVFIFPFQSLVGVLLAEDPDPFSSGRSFCFLCCCQQHPLPQSQWKLHCEMPVCFLFRKTLNLLRLQNYLRWNFSPFFPLLRAELFQWSQFFMQLYPLGETTRKDLGPWTVTWTWSIPGFRFLLWKIMTMFIFFWFLKLSAFASWEVAMVLVCVGICMFYHIIIKQVGFGRDFSRSSRPTLMILFLCPDENHNFSK